MEAKHTPGPETVQIPLDVARWVYMAFLPTNPNKLRSKHPAVVAAAKAFKAAVEEHGDPRAEAIRAAIAKAEGR